ncbi:hypothetical protein JMJ35_010424 [Cladonia borealis]|uniref:MACPF domain-containing protein n=1 Tax=Cladonia borealis TaxID=184061 RepID=A0AA39U444_9LECA|nr:hypothetical protein JMJ35_010424 [Cladonia borealis]
MSGDNPNLARPEDSTFPPSSWLGFGLDMTQSSTLTSIGSVSASVKHTHSVFKLDDESGKVKTTSGVTWTVPKGVGVTADTSEASVASEVFESGTEAAAEFSTKASVSAEFSCVSGSAGLSYATTTSFSSKRSYYLYSYTQDVLNVFLKNWGDMVANKVLENALEDVGPWKEDDRKAQDEYRSLFNRFGSHIITAASYGSRLSLTAWADITNTASDKDFQVNVKAEYKGVTGSVGGEVDVNSKESFKTYEKTQNKICDCRGGDTKLANKIEGSPESDEAGTAREEWIKTAAEHPNVSSFQVEPLWNVVRESSKEVRGRMQDIMNAFTWICANPRTHQTICRFTVTSDWGAFSLLSPAAFIIAGKVTPENCTITSTKVAWGKGTRDIRDAATVEFVIQNDGANIDIELSHGSDGDGRGGEGQCLAEFTTKTYENKGIKGNVSNAQRFYQCPVNPVEAPLIDNTKELRRLLQTEKRMREDAASQAKEELRLRQEAESIPQKTNLREYLEAYHELSRGIRVITNRSLTT